MQRFYPVILQSPLFDQVTAQQLPALLAVARPRLKKFAAGSCIWRAGENTASIGLVCAGQAQIIKENAKGNRLIVATVTAADIFGEAYAYAAPKALPVSVEVVSAATVLFFQPQSMLALMALPAGPQVMRNLLQILAQKSLLLNQKVEILAQRRIADKVLAYLRLEQQRQQTNPILLPYNRQEMADYLGVERSALSAALGEMKQAALIDYHKNQFTLL
ncbi:Crp/Fnr family transcriptional regulator [Loigolactobacillus binensis]|uniref:Crp/Fnr family transcriptional regulator n=1 Tax=Loigolactobacillus binensis TaxID=2559922 RepID=A0ABW3EA24_9LACO|nr:Crp/Fnr family transcriptional regulator [Loigolactobacillus binensis]